MLPVILLTLLGLVLAGQVWVVERERSSVAVIENGRITEIRGLGNLNHGVVKFRGGFAYVLSRDGYISLIDIKSKKLVRRVRVGNSGIGFTFCEGKVAVANYDPKTVVFLTDDLRVIRTLNTGSRNVGIKSWEGKVVFSLMDKDEVWVTTCDGKKVFTLKASQMPFDAMLAGGRYIVGFFTSGRVGVLDLRTGKYRELELGSPEETILKVPHFGTWSVYEDLAYVPAVGERKVYELDLKTLRIRRVIDLPGLPVFVAISPDGRFLAVNFSGDKEDYVAIVDRKDGRVVRLKALGRRILHLKFTPDGLLLVSSYYENRVKKVTVPDLEVLEEFTVPTPSGVFLGG